MYLDVEERSVYRTSEQGNGLLLKKSTNKYDDKELKDLIEDHVACNRFRTRARSVWTILDEYLPTL